MACDGFASHDDRASQEARCTWLRFDGRFRVDARSDGRFSRRRQSSLQKNIDGGATERVGSAVPLAVEH